MRLFFLSQRDTEIDTLRDQLFRALWSKDLDSFRTAYGSLKSLSVDIKKLRYKARDKSLNLKEQFEWIRKQEMDREDAAQPGNAVHDQILETHTVQYLFNTAVQTVINEEFPMGSVSSRSVCYCQ